jgi:aryl-alcohol dehydrogenase-like predicted oxidoreductase
MIKRDIPKTNLSVSTICLGTMTFGTPVGEKDAIRLIHHAIDHGINFIDTANMYEGYARQLGSAGGVAEEIIGKALAGIRDKVIIATKVGMKVGTAPEDEYSSPGAIRKHLELSLKRMKTDVVDIYYLHQPDPQTPLIDILDALNQAIDEGKIRYYGISNYSEKQLSELLSVADENNLLRPVMSQPGFSYLNQEALNRDIALCHREGIAVAPYQVLQGGLLTGKYKRGDEIPKNSRKNEHSAWIDDFSDELFDKLEQFEKLAETEGVSMTQIAIRWVLDQSAVVSAIVGVKNSRQIDDAVEASLANQ